MRESFKIGLSLFEFREMTLAELHLALDAYKENQENYWDSLCMLLTGKSSKTKEHQRDNFFDVMDSWAEMGIIETRSIT